MILRESVDRSLVLYIYQYVYLYSKSPIEPSTFIVGILFGWTLFLFWEGTWIHIYFYIYIYMYTHSELAVTYATLRKGQASSNIPWFWICKLPGRYISPIRSSWNLMWLKFGQRTLQDGRWVSHLPSFASTFSLRKLSHDFSKTTPFNRFSKKTSSAKFPSFGSV